jgi:hypothetical protein
MPAAVNNPGGLDSKSPNVDKHPCLLGRESPVRNQIRLLSSFFSSRCLDLNSRHLLALASRMQGGSSHGSHTGYVGHNDYSTAGSSSDHVWLPSTWS